MKKIVFTMGLVSSLCAMDSNALDPLYKRPRSSSVEDIDAMDLQGWAQEQLSPIEPLDFDLIPESVIARQPIPQFVTPSLQSRVEASDKKNHYLECPHCKTKILKLLVVAHMGSTHPTSQSSSSPGRQILYQCTIKCPKQTCKYDKASFAAEQHTAHRRARDCFFKHMSVHHREEYFEASSYFDENKVEACFQEIS